MADQKPNAVKSSCIALRSSYEGLERSGENIEETFSYLIHLILTQNSLRNGQGFRETGGRSFDEHRRNGGRRTDDQQQMQHPSAQAVFTSQYTADGVGCNKGEAKKQYYGQH